MKRGQVKNNTAESVKGLVRKLNQYRHEYYNEARSSVSDAIYDRMYDELVKLEKETGIIFGDSPTQTVGYTPVGKLKKVKHSVPLLSLDKTKEAAELVNMAEKSLALLMLKLDGLTVKLCYENGILQEASTRGDGEVGEDITHNILSFYNVPVKIPHMERLVIAGEGFIHTHDFEELKGSVFGAGEKEASHSRNLAAGSIRAFDPAVCRQRRIYFHAFHVIEGMEAFGEISDSRGKLLEKLQELGFAVCPFLYLSGQVTAKRVTEHIEYLKKIAEQRQLPIDGMVLRYDSLSYSKSLGRTGHHYKDGIAFKFEDGMHETVFRSIQWTPCRNGDISAVALFDTVEIDGCEVSKATLHNLSFMKELRLRPGCRILVSKRNMIIPHIEANLDMGKFDEKLIPKKCPCCGEPTRIHARKSDKGKIVETLHCDNPDCSSQLIRKLLHFTEKKAMDISGFSEATIEKFVEKGFLNTFHDFYHLDRYRDEIIRMDGFGVKSYERLQAAIEKSRYTTFARYLTAMDIPMIGRTASRALEKHFNGNRMEFAKAAMNAYDFTSLPEFGETMSHNIHIWFNNKENLRLWNTLQNKLHFEREESTMMNANNMNTKNPFTGCTIVATGKLEHFTRDSINSKIISLGAIAGSSVTKKTSYLICGDKPGSKLAKAKELGIPVLTEQQFLSMISA